MIKTLLIITLIALGLSPVRSVGAQAAVPRFEPAPCPFVMPRDEQIECGYLIVPEDRSQPSARTIKIGVAIVKSHSPKPQPDPLIVLNGGPGGRMIEFLPDALPMFEMLLATRDVVLYDQRGAGWSQPTLNCPEVAPLDRQAPQPATTRPRAERGAGRTTRINAFNRMNRIFEIDRIKCGL